MSVKDENLMNQQSEGKAFVQELINKNIELMKDNLWLLMENRELKRKLESAENTLVCLKAEFNGREELAGDRSSVM